MDSATFRVATAEWYIAAPIYASGKGFPVIFDNNGVPVWWWDHPTSTVLATLLPDGNIGWTLGGLSNGGGAEEHALDGSLVRTINTVGGTSDIHDLIQLPNGNFVMVANKPRSNVDLSALGGPAAATILDHVIEELDPNGTVVWSWDTADHIPISEMDPQWYQQYIVNGTAPYDVYHWNSIDFTGDGFVLSFRHMDAVYNIDKTTGNTSSGRLEDRHGSRASPSLAIPCSTAAAASAGNTMPGCSPMEA